MPLPSRFSVLPFVLVIVSSQWLFPQEATGKTQGQDTAEQMKSDSNARFSRTHCEVPDCVHKVLYFSNLSQPTDLQDVVNVIRVIPEIQRAQIVLAERIIVIEGTAEQVALAEKLASEIDRAKRRFGGLGYRIELRIQEFASDKKLHSRLYSFVTEAGDRARVSLGGHGLAQVQHESPPENKPSPDSTARSIECRILSENERTVELNIEAGFASETAQSAASPLLNVRLHVTVELEKPTVISKIDDPDSDRSFTIELTATRIKEKP